MTFFCEREHEWGNYGKVGKEEKVENLQILKEEFLCSGKRTKVWCEVGPLIRG